MGRLVFFTCAVVFAAVMAVRFIDSGVRVPTDVAVVQPPVASSPPRSSAGRIVSISRDGKGHFQVEARIDGRPIPFLVDTGASAIALRESAAVRAGIRVHERDYTIRVSTANGVTRGAPVRLASVDIDGVVVRDVQAVVQPDDVLPFNLLGMTYLSRVRFSYDHGRLVIEQ